MTPVNYGGCTSTCENYNINLGPITADGVSGLNLNTGIYYCCSNADNCNTVSIITPINNYVPRVRSCYTGVGAGVGGLTAGLANTKECSKNNANQFCYKFEYENNGLKVNYKGCTDSCVTGSEGAGPISDTIGLNLLNIRGKYFCCITDNCNFSYKTTSSIVITLGFLALSSLYGLF